MKLFELEDRPELDKVFPRSIMPQVRKNNLEDSGYKFEKKKIKLSKIKPVQDQRVQGMHDRALKGFQDGSIRPIIIDKHNYIVNGHHRYDVARSLDFDKVKVLKVDATIEELIDHYKDKTSDAPTIEEQFKAKLQQKLKEIHSAKPYDNMDDNGLIRLRYDDATGPQEFGEEGHLKLAPIPGISKNEVYDNGVSRHIFLMNNKEPIFLLTIKRGLDGWVTTNVVTHSNYRGKGFAVPVYLAVSKAYGDPLYSFGTQSPGGHKIWQNLAKQHPNRVTGYDVTTKQEVPFSDVFDGKVATRAKLLPESIQRGDCFEAAIKQMLEYAKENPAMLNSLSLVHGYVTGQGSYVKDQRYGHGWLEIGDVVHDCTKNAIMRKEQYYKLGNINPNELKKYSYKDVLQKISATKHYGPWDLQKTEFEKGMEESVVGMNPHAKKPYFTPQEADRANAEWINQAQVDQEDGVIIKSTDGKQYVIMTSYGNQHYEDGEVYLDGVTDPGYIEIEGYPDAAELLYYHSATGHYPADPDEVSESQQNLPAEVQQFVNSLTPDDVGVDNVGEYVVHYEGFTDQCNDGHDDNSIDNVYADVYKDFDMRQGTTPLIRGVANDELGCENNPVLYSVYKNVNEGDVVDFPGTYVKKDYVTINGVKMLRDVWDYMSQDREEEHGFDGNANRVKKGISNFTGDEDPEVLKKAYQIELRNFIDEFENQDMDPQPFIDELEQIDENYISQDVTKQGRNLSAKVKQYLKGKKTELTIVKVSDLDMDTPGFDRIIGDLGDVNFADTTDPIVVDADGKTILDGFHRVQKAKDIGKEVIPAYMVVENFAGPRLSAQQMLAKLSKEMQGTHTGASDPSSDWSKYVLSHKGFTLKDIQVAKIPVSVKSDGMNQANIERYKKADTTKFPPVVIGNNGYLLDGNHRLLAYKYQGIKTIKAYIGENFKDGKVKGKSRPGRVKKAGASCKGSVTSLRKKAKNSSGEKAKMYHWCANMKAGRKKK